MRILHISKYYFPYLGGVESICKYLVERMPKHITSVVCFNNQRENAVDEINGHRIYRIATFVNIARQALSLSYKNGLRWAILTEKPDVIHIHGTEFQFAYAMALAADDVGVIERVAVSIQGMTSVYAHHFFGNLPRNYTPSRTLKEWIIKDGAKDRYNAFVRRGKYETETIKLVKNILGRTRWDYINCLKINPDMNYYKANETLRNSFYSSVWNYESCVKHTIFVSQAGTILKSFHMVLDAITIVKKFYPNVQVKVAGPRIIEGNRLKGNSYGLFIKNKIQSLELENNVEFLGPQNEIQMKEHMLKSNVFVSASSIENSPNSLGEAMLLGMPCISSDVGGVSDLMQHNEEGYIYPADAPEMLAYYIIKVFEDGKTAEKYGKKARVHAMDTHNPQQNWNDLWKIYSKLMEESRKKG